MSGSSIRSQNATPLSMKFRIGFIHRKQRLQEPGGAVAVGGQQRVHVELPPRTHRLSSDSRPAKSIGAASSVSVLTRSGFSALYSAASVPPMQ